MTHEYADCYFCGGSVEEHIRDREMHFQGKLILIENVPMGVCKQCGEKYILAEVAEQIDSILKNAREPEKKIEIPVYQFVRMVA